MRERVTRALVFPFQDPAWLAKIGIGGAAGLLVEALFVAIGFLASREVALEASPVALVCNFPALGFALRVFQGAVGNPQAKTMPEWSRWPALCLSGLVAFALGLAYGIGPLVLVIAGLTFLLRGGPAFVLGVTLMLLGMLAGVTLGFFLPMAVAKYLAERRIDAAFHLVAIWQAIRQVLAEYLAAYLLAIGALVVVGLIGVIPLLGATAWPFLAFYLMVVGARLFGGVCLGGSLKPSGRPPEGGSVV